jgi:hypothetical protein
VQNREVERQPVRRSFRANDDPRPGGLWQEAECAESKFGAPTAADSRFRPDLSISIIPGTAAGLSVARFAFCDSFPGDFALRNPARKIRHDIFLTAIKKTPLRRRKKAWNGFCRNGTTST